jgi:hypothetical protein
MSKHLYQNYYAPPSSIQKFLRTFYAMPARWTNTLLGMDISGYQHVTAEDAQRLKAAGVKFIIAKSSQGSWWQDKEFANTVQVFYKLLPVIAYHWIEPESYCQYPFDKPEKWPKTELDNMIACIKNKAICGIMLDVEDQKTTATWLANVSKIYAGWTHDWMTSYYSWDMPLINYTGEWVWNKYKDGYAWMSKYLLNVAKYPYDSVPVETDWATLQDKWMPPATTVVPTLSNDKWTFWQFSGDKFTLPFVTNPTGGKTKLDLVLYNGNQSQFDKQFNWVSTTTPPVVDPPVVPPVDTTEMEKAITALEVRVAALETWRKS